VIEVSGLLSSWTTPAASSPRVASRSARTICCCSASICDMSWPIATTASIGPPGAPARPTGAMLHTVRTVPWVRVGSATVTAAWCWPISAAANADVRYCR